MNEGLSSVAQSPMNHKSGGQGPQGGDLLGKESFLKLLVTQLSNQDPMSPAEPTEFLGQLAQFTSLEQLVNVNEGLDVLAISQTAATSAEMVSFVGKEITFAGDGLMLDEVGQAQDIEFELGGQAKDVTVQIVDSSGDVVRSLDAGQMVAGPHTVHFDGRDENGNKLPVGSYSLQISAFDEEGATVNVNSLSKGKVMGVTFEMGYPKLLLEDGREITLNQIIEVTEPTAPPIPEAAEDTSETSDDSAHATPDPGDAGEPDAPATPSEPEASDDDLAPTEPAN